MYNIKLNKRTQNITLKKVARNVRLNKRVNTIKLHHTGRRGPEGQEGKQGVSFYWRGDWSLGANYVRNDVVQHNGSSYIAILESTGNTATEPGAGGAWTANWNLMASKGSKGDIGEGGTGSGDKNYVQPFEVTDFLLVQHNLDKDPAVTVIDSANSEVIGEVTYLNRNALTLRFAAPFSGRVTCN